MGNVAQPTLQNLGTGLVVSGARHTESIHHWPNLGFLVQKLVVWGCIPVVSVAEPLEYAVFSARMITAKCYAALVLQPTVVTLQVQVI